MTKHQGVEVLKQAKMEAETKTWGKRPFWGLSFDCDPQWFLTEEQREIQRKLIELCRTTLRPNAVSSLNASML